MKPFLLCCREAAQLRLFAQLKPYSHFIDGVDAYSIQDLIDVQSGVLEVRLKTVLESYTKHIKFDCQVNERIILIHLSMATLFIHTTKINYFPY